ncbi:MAG: hypothetical protein ABSG62_10695 [Terracidiphilus sp.]
MARSRPAVSQLLYRLDVSRRYSQMQEVSLAQARASELAASAGIRAAAW